MRNTNKFSPLHRGVPLSQPRQLLLSMLISKTIVEIMPIPVPLPVPGTGAHARSHVHVWPAPVRKCTIAYTNARSCYCSRFRFRSRAGSCAVCIGTVTSMDKVMKMDPCAHARARASVVFFLFKQGTRTYDWGCISLLIEIIFILMCNGEKVIWI